MSILLLRYAKSRLLLNIDGDVTNSFSSYLAIIGIDGSQ